VFWSAVWKFCDVVATPRGDERPWDEVVVGLDRMLPPAEEGPRWFEGARLNFAENLLRHRGSREALVFWNEEGRQRARTYDELYREVAIVASVLRGMGVGIGDRVAGFMPNIPETVVAMLATSSIGAIWTSCSPDFGVTSVLDRLGQIKPKVLFSVDGYRYATKIHDCLERVSEIADQIPEIELVIVVDYASSNPDVSGIRSAVRYSYVLADSGEEAPVLSFEQLPFDHPLYIMYSSGTTGLPKCMVHSSGGTLLQHLKELVLHTDLKPEDTIFYFTTCGWMMWNWLVSSLATGATVVLYDGSPVHPDPNILMDMAEKEKITVFGTSAKYISLIEKEGLRPRDSHDLSALRTILSTGSPLLPESYDYVYESVKEDVCLSSISGGTDLISCFALGNPFSPVYRGEIQARGLGMKVDAFDDTGNAVLGASGELVCTMPFPSMPIRFWNDESGELYRKAYFDRYPGAWCHGDWIEITQSGGLVISGRSDATLNPAGVRIGTAEIYRQVEQLPEVLEAIVVGQEWEGDTRVVLFVRLRDGVELDMALQDIIRKHIRTNATPRHVPSKILQVADIPRTRSGKISELAVSNVIHGRAIENTAALANPEALEFYRNRSELDE
jgi:acetoacetyl-CoA synthetase